jgi:hypothetical protein
MEEDNANNKGKLTPIILGLIAAIVADVMFSWHGYSIIICIVVGIIIVALLSVTKKKTPNPYLLKIFERPASESYVGNLYERAVDRNETIDFLLGKGLYYMPTDLREWCGQHDPGNSFRHMEEYTRIYGNEKMLRYLEQDMIELLKLENLSTEHFNFIVDYVRRYQNAFHNRKILHLKWEVSTDIKGRITYHLNNFTHLYGTKGGPFDCGTPRNEFFTKNAGDNISRIKREFGVDLLINQ